MTTANPQAGRDRRARRAGGCSRRSPACARSSSSCTVAGAAERRRRRRRRAEVLPGVRYKIAVASGKGGVGKSTVAANLALALQARRRDRRPARRRHLRPVAADDDGVHRPAAWSTQAEKILPVDGNGVKVMSLGFLMDPDTAGDLARADGDEGAAAVPRGRRVGHARLPGGRPAAGHRRRPAHDHPAGAARRRGDRHHAAGRGADRRPQGARDVPQGQRAGARRWSRTCRRSSARTAANAARSSSTAAAGAPPSELGVPVPGRHPDRPGDRRRRRRRARRSSASHPDSPAAQAFIAVGRGRRRRQVERRRRGPRPVAAAFPRERPRRRHCGAGGGLAGAPAGAGFGAGVGGATTISAAFSGRPPAAMIACRRLAEPLRLRPTAAAHRWRSRSGCRRRPRR